MRLVCCSLRGFRVGVARVVAALEVGVELDERVAVLGRDAADIAVLNLERHAIRAVRNRAP